jgi:hypothetical protein
MTNLSFSKATKTQSRLRLALVGPSGSGKTYTALTIAQHLGKRVAVIDTERGSASKYADIFTFDVLNLDTFSPLTYVDAIKAAESAGYDVLVIDSLSHAWMGKEGALEQVDNAAKRSSSHNSYTAWRDVTPMHNALIDAMLQSKCHIIGTMRSKTEYVIEEDERGKKVPRKVGMAPVQRDGLEYEFDVVGDMDLDNNFLVSKTRCPALAGKVIKKPGKPLADTLAAWLSDGAKPQEPELRVDIPTPEAASVKSSNTTDAPAPANGNGYARPMAPEALKDAITRKAGKHSGATISDGAKGLMVGQLNALFGGDENKRHQFTKYLTGYGSTKQMPGNVCQAILDWIGSDDEMAKREANSVIAYLDGQNGQGSLLDAA